MDMLYGPISGGLRQIMISGLTSPPLCGLEESRMKLKSFEAEEQGNRVQVVTTYELPRLAAVLTMTYLIGGNGEIRISEQLAVDKEKKDMPHLFRFGSNW